MKVIEPKIRKFICLTAHPTGCAQNVKDQIEVVKQSTPHDKSLKNVLVIGSSTGYGLASSITAAFGYGATTTNIFFERPSEKGKPASAGWYNMAAFEQEALAAGLNSRSFNGDAFSQSIKEEVITHLKSIGPVDLIVYSLAAPRRTDPSGTTFNSVLKPIGKTFQGKHLDTDKNQIVDVHIEPANDEEVADTIKVMGGEDWQLWIEALKSANLLASGVKTVAYSYIGPELTWDVYRDGTIGRAKQHVDETSDALNQMLAEYNGAAFVSVNKAIVTQASAAIPTVPLYASFLISIMKQKGTHEGAIEQIVRLFKDHLYGNALNLDDARRIRIDDLEMAPEVQSAVKDAFQHLDEQADLDSIFQEYHQAFKLLFGFGHPGVDYTQPVNPEAEIPSLMVQS